MVATAIDLEVSYSQLAIFASSLPLPFNDWADRHVTQGFAWRPGSVSFRTILESGRHTVEIDFTDHVSGIHPEAVRAVEVPFDVPADGAIEIGGITETVPLSAPAGSFLLRCEFFRPGSGDGGRARLTFARKDAPRFAIVRADPELSIEGELLTTAQPAFG